MPYFSTYAATKAFVLSFGEAIAEEDREFGVQVLAVMYTAFLVLIAFLLIVFSLFSPLIFL